MSAASANPAQVTEAMVEALVLMVDAFLSRNGGSFPMDEVTEEQRLWKKAMKAAYAVIGQPRTRERDEKLAAIGAGGQAVAEPGLFAERVIAACRAYMSTYDVLAVEVREHMQVNMADALRASDALSQPHPADERVVEALRKATGVIDTLIESLSEGLMTDAGLSKADRVGMKHQITALELAKEGIAALSAKRPISSMRDGEK